MWWIAFAAVIVARGYGVIGDGLVLLFLVITVLAKVKFEFD